MKSFRALSLILFAPLCFANLTAQELPTDETAPLVRVRLFQFLACSAALITWPWMTKGAAFLPLFMEMTACKSLIRREEHESAACRRVKTALTIESDQVREVI